MSQLFSWGGQSTGVSALASFLPKKLYSLQPKMEKLYTVSQNKTGIWLWLRSWTPYCQFRLKLKKVGKTTRPFRYDLNQIPHDYTEKVRNRLKGLDLIERVPDELRMGGSWHCTGGSNQDHPQEKEMQKGKMVVWGGLTKSYEKKKSEQQRRKGKIYPHECRVPKNSKER